MNRRPGRTRVSKSDAPRKARSGRAVLTGSAITVICGMPLFLAVAMPVQISQDLSLSITTFGLGVSAYFGTTAVVALHAGRLADAIGALRSILAAGACAATACAGIALVAASLMSFIPWLMLGGCALALAQPAANRLLTERVRLERLGVAFGVKQAAPPMASTIAGFVAPLVAVQLGWRWAYGIAALSALLLTLTIARVLDVPRPPRRTARQPRAPLRNRPALSVLLLALTCSFIASTNVLTFYVDASVRVGLSEQQAGFLLGLASVSALLARLVAGAVCDRWPVDPLRLAGGMLGVGSLGILLLGAARPSLTMWGGIVALVGTWGFPGIFWLALMRAYPDTPGRVSGALAPATFGGAVGPILFGLVAGSGPPSTAWTSTAIAGLLASTGMVVGARLLAHASAHPTRIETNAPPLDLRSTAVTRRIALVLPGSDNDLPAEEIARRVARMRSYFATDVEVEHFYNQGNSIFETGFSKEHAESTFDNVAQRICEAAATHPDVIMVHGGIEPGMWIAQQSLDSIPVVGTALSTYTVAAFMNLRLGLLVYEDGLIDPIMDLARFHRMDHLVVGCRSIGISLSELYDRREEVRRRVIEVGRRLVEEDGASGVFAQGLSMVPAAITSDELRGHLGVPALDGELITARTAAMVAGLGLAPKPPGGG